MAAKKYDPDKQAKKLLDDMLIGRYRARIEMLGALPPIKRALNAAYRAGIKAAKDDLCAI